MNLRGGSDRTSQTDFGGGGGFGRPQHAASRALGKRRNAQAIARRQAVVIFRLMIKTHTIDEEADEKDTRRRGERLVVILRFTTVSTVRELEVVRNPII
jgi:hypothetical protein